MAWIPVQQAKTYELVIQQIRSAILDGSFAPGTRLPSVKSLSESLGVGQSAVREALSALRVTGLVEVRQGNGTFVASLNHSDIVRSVERAESMANSEMQALLELRMSIEAGASYYAALRRQTQHLEDMQSALRRMESDLSDFVSGEDADWQFHYAIARASHNPYMQSLMETISSRIRSSLRKSREMLFQIPAEGHRLLSQHQAIYEAIEEQMPDGASEAMLTHLQHVLVQLGEGKGENS